MARHGQMGQSAYIWAGLIPRAAQSFVALEDGDPAAAAHHAVCQAHTAKSTWTGILCAMSHDGAMPGGNAMQAAAHFNSTHL